MSIKRTSDPSERTWFRTDRMTEDGGLWFFHTREKTLEGPFASLFDAKMQLDRYIKVQNSGLLANKTEKYSLCLH